MSNKIVKKKVKKKQGIKEFARLNSWNIALALSIMLFVLSIITGGFSFEKQSITGDVILTTSNGGKLDFDLFVMSECPYGIQAETIAGDVLKAFGKEINFNLYFIANKVSDTEFQSLHGPEEVEEDKRQLCVAKYYPETYFNYILCQNENIKSRKDLSITWQDCLKENNMNVNKIQECMDEEADELLSENIKKAEELKVTGSPTIYFNGVKYNGARTASAFQKAICDIDSTLKGCSINLNTTQAQAPTGSC